MGHSMCPWILGTDRFGCCCSGEVPRSCPSPCGMLRSILRALPELSAGWREKLWEKGRGLGLYVSSSLPLKQRKGCEESPWPPSGPKFVVGHNSSLKNTSVDPKHFFKRWKIKCKLIFQILDELKDLLLIDILPSKRGVILRGRIWWWQGILMHNAVAQNNRILM